MSNQEDVIVVEHYGVAEFLKVLVLEDLEELLEMEIK
jgi:hypothetical protein